MSIAAFVTFQPGAYQSFAALTGHEQVPVTAEEIDDVRRPWVLRTFGTESLFAVVAVTFILCLNFIGKYQGRLNRLHTREQCHVGTCNCPNDSRPLSEVYQIHSHSVIAMPCPVGFWQGGRVALRPSVTTGATGFTRFPRFMLVFALGLFTPTMAMFLDSSLLLKLLACKLLLMQRVVYRASPHPAPRLSRTEPHRCDTRHCGLDILPKRWPEPIHPELALARPTGPLDASLKPLVDSLHIEDLVNAEVSRLHWNREELQKRWQSSQTGRFRQGYGAALVA